MLFAAIVGGDCDMGNDDIWQNYWTANKRITKILLLLTMVSTNVDIVCQEDLPVGVDPVEHFLTILFKHSQLKALVKLVLLQLPQLQWDLVKTSSVQFLWIFEKQIWEIIFVPTLLNLITEYIFLVRLKDRFGGLFLLNLVSEYLYLRISLVWLNNRFGELFLSQFGRLFLLLAAVSSRIIRVYMIDYKDVFDWL